MILIKFLDKIINFLIEVRDTLDKPEIITMTEWLNQKNLAFCPRCDKCELCGGDGIVKKEKLEHIKNVSIANDGDF